MMRRFLLIAVCLLITPDAFATEVKEVVSKSGIKAWLVQEHALPLVAVKVVFKGAGFAYDPPGKEGRTAMSSALLMEGAGDMNSSRFNAALENDAIQMNFGTDEDMLRGSFESLSEHKEKAFSYLALALTKPRFDSDAIERVRSQTLSVLTQQEREPGYLLQRGWQKLAFGEHPYANPVLGTHDTIKALQHKDFATFAKRYITRDNMLIAVVGDITPEELSRLIDTHLANLPERYDPDVTVSETKLPGSAQQKIIRHDVPQTMISFGAQGLKRNDPEYFTGFVMNQILGGGSLSAKLSQEIRGKRGLTYSVYSQLDPMMYTGVWGGGFSTRNDQVGAAVDALRSTLNDFAKNGPTDKELANAKKYLTGSFVLGLDSNGEIASYLVSMQLYNLGMDYLDRRNGMIEAVTREQVKALAARIVDPSKLLIVMVGEPKLTKESP